LLVKEKFAPRQNSIELESFRNLWKKNSPFSRVVLVLFVFSLGALPIELVLYRFLDLAVPVGFIPLLFFVYHTVFVGSSIVFGRMVDRVGERRVLAIGFFIASIAYILFAFFSNFWILVLGVVLLGLYIGAVDGTSRAYAANLVDNDLLATSEGMLNASRGIAVLFAGICGGALWTYVGAEYAFGYSFMFSFLGLFGLFWIERKATV
jgi:MFS family permease